MAAKITKASEYAERFNRVFDYIDKHLGDALTVDQLSEIAAFSKFHFHRQFSAYAGISVFRYIQLMRLKRASHRLVFNTHARIVDIALEAGFENPESFSRAFKNTFGQTPSQFRAHPKWEPWKTRYRLPRDQRRQNVEVKIVDFERTMVAVLEHCGPPELVNDSARQFIEWRKQSKYSPVTTSRTFGIAYDDPETAEPERFRFDICGSVTEEIPPNPQGVVNKIIPAGRCAVVRHLGAHDRLGESAYYLCRQWLPGSGEELRDFPLFFHYLNLLPDTEEHELITDVYLPLK